MDWVYTRFMLEAIFVPPIITFDLRAIIGLLVMATVRLLRFAALHIRRCNDLLIARDNRSCARTTALGRMPT